MNNIFRCRCLRCGHEWSTKQDRPRVCPKCKTPYWDIGKSSGKPIEVFGNKEKWEASFKAKIRKNKWGRWKYNPDTHCLEIVKLFGGHKYSYDVDLNRCNTGSRLLDWIYQVQGKNFISPDDVADLVYAVDDILHVVQSKLCSFGRNMQFDVNHYLSERIDPLFK